MSKSQPAPQTISIDGFDVEVVRVQDVANKHEFSTTKARADELGDAVKVLDKPAVDIRGRLLPAKPHRSIDEAAAVTRRGGTASTQGRAPTSKEESK